MGIIRNDGNTPGGQRECLQDCLPLDTPFMVQIFPSYVCNFRCSFCLHALERQQHGYISDVPYMDMPLFRKCIEDMRCFPHKLKMLRFAALGEPLLHKNIVEMVAFAKQANIAESIDIVTNGTLLTQALSDGLIHAGLDRLRISVNGLSEEDYFQNTHAHVKFEEFIEQIRYFYEHRKNTHVYIKIIDYMVRESDMEKRFYDLFQPISDSIAIEHLTPTIAEIDYQKISDGAANDQTQNGSRLVQAEVCPQPFYMMQINADGKVVPCCSAKYPAVLGDANLTPVPEIWNSATFNQFRKKMLRSRQEAGAVCQNCNLYLYDLHPEDLLDNARERLKFEY